MRVKDLKANPKNPRRITDEKLKGLKKTLAEFGDLSGIVFNRRTKRLVGGHQRAKVISPHNEVVVDKKFSKPTKVGTVLEGNIFLDNGERMKYREVDWDETKEKAANIAANKGVGEWDVELLSEMLREISDFGFDMDLTLFDKDELSELLVPTLSPNFEPGNEDEQGQLDRKKPVTCPHCDKEFVPE